MNEERPQPHKRARAFAAVLLLLVGVSVATPLAVSAQMVVTSLPNTLFVSEDPIKEIVEKPFLVSMLGVLINFTDFIAQRIAYDAAVAIATAGNGEEPLINLQDPTDYFNSLAEDVGGAFVDGLSATLAAVNINFNICAPQAPAARLVLQFGIKSAMGQRPEPVCDWQSIAGNWEGFVADSFGDDNPDQFLLSNFAQAINPRTTDLTAGLTLYTQIIDDTNLNKSVSFGKYLSDHGVKDAVDVVTGNVKTPASVIDETWKRAAIPDPYDRQQQLFNAMLEMKDVWKQMGLSMLSTFTNTLLSKFTERIYSGLFDVQIDESSPFDVASIGFSGGVEAVEAHFRTLLAFSPIKLDTYNIISDFTTCPGTTTRGLDNCVLDSNFATAIGGADSGDPFTVQEAIDDSLVNGDWPLIAATDSRNIDDSCYTYGFCYANLVRLRLARVIPVGWEMAATLQDGSSTDTLQTVIDAFDDESSAYYHLIDPNWVLKYPTTQCNVLGAGQLVSDAGNQRGNECVDAPSCIREDASGACVGGYGYCAREENTWNFRGTECPEQFATCLAFDNGNGVDGDWLLNTADTEGCDADNAGCLWYSTQQEADSTGAFDWPSIDDVPTLDAAAGTYMSRLYFNNNVEECDSEDAGCTRVIEKTSDTALNLVLNPSLETDDDADDTPDNWIIAGNSVYKADTGNEVFGTDAAAVGDAGTAGTVSQVGIPLQQSAFYTLSFYAAQQTTGASESAAVYVIMASEDGSEPVDLSGTSYETANCFISNLDSSGAEETIEMNVTPTDDSYERFTCTFTSPTFTDAELGLRVQSLRFVSKGLFIDGIQLEAGEDVSDFRTGYGAEMADMNPQYFKLPPAYLGCTGDEAVDLEDCADYAPVCSALEVGCDLYTPENGDPSVPGIANDLDECPSTCAGYDTFKQEPTNYEPLGDPAVYFIPSTAVACSETYVGCDEFTNLSDESLEYYTTLRACLTTAQTSDEANFYTWEGSDLEGFQLKSWALLESDLSSSDAWSNDAVPESAPCTSWSTTSSSIVCNDDASALEDDRACNAHDDIFDEPDCREFYDADGFIHYRRFSDTVSMSDSCADYRKTDIAGDTTTEQDANCTDAGGFWNGTIGECRFYGLAEESDDCPAEVNGCREYVGGTGRNSSVVYEDDVEDEDVDEYVSSGADVEVSNESVATDGHSLHISATTAGGYVAVGNAELTSACADASGCEASEGTLGFTCTVDDEATDCGELVDELASGKTYVLSFWAKGNVADVVVTPKFLEESGSSSGTARAFDAVTLSTSWERYVVGPLDTTDFADFDDSAELAFVISGLNDEAYIDNITLRQTEEAITVIKDSWNTPAACDETPEGASSPQYYLGCQEYSNSDGDAAYLKSFTRLCSENKVGCEAFFNTQSSDSPYTAVYNLSCEYGQSSGSYNPTTAAPVVVSAVTDCAVDGTSYCSIAVGESSCQFDVEEGMVPRGSSGRLPSEDSGSGGYGMKLALEPDAHVVSSDALTYFVADASYECDSEVMGCTAVGLPTFSADQTRVDSWTDAYMLDVVDDYSDILCQQNALFCDAWDTTQDGTYYFKNPETKTCEYRTNVSIDGADFTGWFRTGSDQFCYGTGACSVSGTACATDSDCTASTDEETDSCVIDTGTYLLGGTESGVWRNGDGDYDGWVGECSSQYDLCSEFVDPVDVDQDAGEQYGVSSGSSSFFLNNDLLDESNLAASKRCNGQVSQKRGCVLFENTTDAELNYNASASYTLSVHADQFYSDSQSYDLVDPVSCPDNGDYTALNGESVDLCATRCAYSAENLHPYDDYSTASGADLYDFTTSCLIDADCPSVKSDGGDAVVGTCVASSFTGSDSSTVTVPALEDDTNEIQKVELDRACAEWLACNTTTKVYDENTQSFVNVCDSIGLCNEYNALGETTTCSNWVVDAVPTVLTTDEYQGRDVSWYGQDYSGFSIPGTVLASHLVQENVNPVRWCVNGSLATTPEAGEDLPYIDCSEDDDVCSDLGLVCVSAEEDFRLVFNAGTCDTATTSNGDDCKIGFCEDTGSPCSIEGDCNLGAACAVGYCAYGGYRVGYECSIDADCDSLGEFNHCASDGYCARQTVETCNNLGDCTDPDAQGGVPDCVAAAKSQTGLCVNESCLTQPSDNNDDGKLDAFSFDEAEALACRAWPEATAPFGNDVVSTWVNAATLGTPDSTIGGSDEQPYEKKSTFENVNVCAGGQTCDCSYDTVTYGTSKTMYFDESAADAPAYVCVGGNYDGAECSGTTGYLAHPDTSDTTNNYHCADDGGGTCSRLTTDQTKVGLQGFCLQRDTALTMNGDQNQAPCLAWLPVDRAAGATDIYGKSYEAGYPLTDTFYCAEPALYVNLKPSNVNFLLQDTSSNSLYTTASAEFEGEDILRDCGSYDYDNCAANVGCPSDYFALMGKCWEGGTTATGDEVNSYAYRANNVNHVNDNDCPYVCIPENSFAVDGTGGLFTEGASCDNFADDEKYNNIDTSLLPASGDYFEYKGTSNYNDTPVYAVHAAYNDYDTIVNGFLSCERMGVEWDPSFVDDTHFAFPMQTGLDTVSYGDGYWNLALDFDTYVGCRTMLQTSSEEGNTAWTNRVWESGGFTVDDGGTTSLEYIYSTPDPIFGQAGDPSVMPYGISSTDQRPYSLASCTQQNVRLGNSACSNIYASDTCGDGSGYDSTSGSRVNVTIGPLSASLPTGTSFDTCPSGFDSPPFDGVTNTDPEARAFIGFEFDSSTYVEDSSSHTNDLDFGAETIVSDSIDRIGELFAGIKSLYIWDDSTGDESAGYTESDTVTPEDGAGYVSTSTVWTDTGDSFGSGGNSGVPSGPVVRSVGSTCVGSYCREGDDGKFSINGDDSGDLTSSGGTFFADLKFFVEANPNQLPIRRVIIDWADEPSGNYSGSLTDDNYYKNRRGLDAINEQYCTDDAPDNFGVTLDACDSNYFNASHYFTCSQGFINTLDACAEDADGNLETSPCAGSAETTCVYQPRVHVRDNWGWCTGECGNTTGGCYTYEGSLSNPDPDTDQCNFEDLPSGSGAWNPWIYYDGVITVEP